MPLFLRLFIGLILFPQVVLAQTEFSGLVQDAATHQPIAYATVGLIKANTGTSSREDGRFEMTVTSPKENDTLLFQALGYEPLKMAVSGFSASGKTVLLHGKVNEMAEVAVRPKALLQTTVLNPNPKSSRSSYGTSGFITQIAQHLTAPQLPALLEEVSIRKLHIPLFVPANATFRLRIYGMDAATGGPGEDLLTQSLEVKATGSKVAIDLRPYQLYLHEKDFFVAVEWLKIPENEEWYTAKENGKKVRRFSGYWPSIEVSKNETPENNCWIQTYTGNWQKSTTQFHILGNRKPVTNFAIEAQVRY